MKSELIRVTKRLVRFKSTNDNKEQLQKISDFCAAFLKDCNLRIKNYKRNGYPSLVVSDRPTRTFDILMAAHLDVVSGKDKEFIPRIEQNRLYGRGAWDMKGQVAVLLLLLPRVIKLRPDLKIGLMLTCDEEIGGFDGVGYLLNKEKYRSRLAVVPDGGWERKLIIAQKGVLQFKLTALGKGAHSSRPWLGENAIDKLFLAYKKLKKIFPNPIDEDDWRPSVNLSKISGGQAYNGVPDKAEAIFDFRYTEDKSAQEWEKDIKKTIKGLRVSYKRLVLGDNFFIDKKNDYIQQFKIITKKIFKNKLEFSRETGSSDARFFSAFDIPVIITRPKGGNAHGNKEWVDIGSLVKFYNILENFIHHIKV